MSTFSSDFWSSNNSLTTFETEDADFKYLKNDVKVCNILSTNYRIKLNNNKH